METIGPATQKLGHSMNGLESLEMGMRTLLSERGFDLKSGDTYQKTPMRFAAALGEMLSGYDEDPKSILERTFDADYDQMVIVRSLPFWSLCEHHVLPFHGRATIGYIPQGKVLGLSKLPRLLRCLSRRLQMQEKLTMELAQSIEEAIAPRGVGVLLRATHLCMVVRGIESDGEMVTSSLTGVFRDLAVREEFLRLADGK